MVVVPNINCLGRHLIETRWEWVLPWHCNYFTPGSLQKLLQGEGFVTVEHYLAPTPLYYLWALIRTFPNALVKWVVGRIRVLAMGLCAPLAFVGKWLGKADNFNVWSRLE